MAQITVPFAATWLRLYISIFLAIAFVAGTRPSIKSLIACIQIGRGAKPLPPYLPSQKFAQAGMLICAVSTAFCLGCGYLALLLLTTGPTTLTDRGIQQGGRPPYYREIFVPWTNVVRVSCRYTRRSSRIGTIALYSNDEEQIVIGNGGLSLEDARAFIARHVPAGTLQPCR